MSRQVHTRTLGGALNFLSDKTLKGDFSHLDHLGFVQLGNEGSNTRWVNYYFAIKHFKTLQQVRHLARRNIGLYTLVMWRTQ